MMSAPVMQRPHGLSEATSLYFDLLRLIAAVLVVVEHLRLYGLVPDSFPLSTYSHEAVIAFFVLSGAVISHTANRPGVTPRRFAIARIARIYSVAVPAIIWAHVVSMIAPAPPPSAVSYGVVAESPSWLSTLTSLLFLNENWMILREAWWNGPYWSLCYEVWYYVIFAGFWFSSNRWRIPVALLLAALAGPRILILFPIWIAGVFFAYLVPRLKENVILGAVLFVASIAALVVVNESGVQSLVWQTLHGRIPEAWVLQTSAYFVTDYLLGAIFLLNFVAVRLCETPFSRLMSRAANVIRAGAASTFSIYLFHYPVVIALAGTSLANSVNLATGLAILVAILVLCWLLSLFTERKKNLLAGWLWRLIADRNQPQKAPV